MHVWKIDKFWISTFSVKEWQLSSEGKGNYFDTKEWFVCYEYNFYSFGKLVSDQKANII